MRALVTGIAGFAGSHLAAYLLRHAACEVHGIVHRYDWRILDLREQLTLWRGDLRNPLWVSEVIQKVQPDYLLHLAAWSEVGGSWEQPWTTFELNVQTQLSLLEAVRKQAPACRVLVVGSNEMYGKIEPGDLPIDEETPLRPHNPYGVSKAAQDGFMNRNWRGWSRGAGTSNIEYRTKNIEWPTACRAVSLISAIALRTLTALGLPAACRVVSFISTTALLKLTAPDRPATTHSGA